MKKLARMGALGLAALLMLAPASLAQEKPDGKAEGEKPAEKGKAIPATPMVRPGAEGTGDNALEISGVVLAADGKPAAGVNVGTGLSVANGELKVSGKPVTTDAEGKFTVGSDKRMLAGRGVTIVAAMSDGSMIGTTTIASGTKPEDVGTPSLSLEKATKVTINLSTDEIEGGLKSPSASANRITDAGESFFQSSSSDEGALTLYLVNGNYELRLGSRDRGMRELKSEYVKVTVDGSKPIDLGNVKLVKGPLFAGIGKPAPELTVTHVRGTTNTRLSGFKGKWVLLDFWGVW